MAERNLIRHLEAEEFRTIRLKDSQFQAARACLRGNYSRKDDVFSLGTKPSISRSRATG